MHTIRLDDVDQTRCTRLSELFGANRDTLIVYSFTYGPEMKQACTYNTHYHGENCKGDQLPALRPAHGGDR
jgi:predicted dithiol-disulfide oxidoreductase (DUF899 family)